MNCVYDMDAGSNLIREKIITGGGKNEKIYSLIGFTSETNESPDVPGMIYTKGYGRLCNARSFSCRSKCENACYLWHILHSLYC